MSRTGRIEGRRGRTGPLSLLAGLLVLALVGHGAVVARAKDLDDYATWDDVVAAQDDVDEQNRLIEEINGQIQQLKTDVAEAELVAEQKGAAYSAAEQAATAQSETVYGLQLEADTADAEAEEAEAAAAAYVAAMSNRVTIDPTVQLLTNPGESDDFLKGMSTLSKLGTENGSLYEQAVAARNNAEQLNEQAERALAELQVLEAEAQTEYESAVAAQLDLQEKRDRAVEKGSELEAMLVPLMEHRDVVEADYQEGERLREAERKRIEQERAEAAERARQEAQQNQGGGSAPPPPPASGANSSGYASPIASNAYVTSPFGMRIHPIYGYPRLHAGLDLVVPQGTCWTPLYAVEDATVTYSGWMDGWGYIVIMQAGDGTVIKYPHISEGGLNVNAGQHVGAGQVIAYAGTTGPSTGCHLHFQVEVGGTPIDSRVWLADRGIYF
ncbi:M23 family metallopeptidase [Gulosibacter sp. 10]|uniref:M23 family metallopeptidase n=1 Tax=Gulosibacter sp. 10 TaxID=1255570 RepID=UPI001123D3A3|nr:M23 family metallopeptidase [Gulosibacter sp. 10]